MKKDTELLDLKLKYNELINRHKKAEEYFKIASPEAVEKWLPAFHLILRELSKLIYQIPEITEDEILNGFLNTS